MEGIKYFDVVFCHDHLLTKPNIWAESERNQCFKLYNLLKGFLMDTLIIMLFDVDVDAYSYANANAYANYNNDNNEITIYNYNKNLPKILCSRKIVNPK